MPSLGDMSVSFSADVSGLMSGLNSAKNAISLLANGGPLALVGTGLAAAGAAAIAFGAKSVDMASNFQQSMLKVQAYAGLSKKQTDDMSNSILTMASNLGQSPKAMADAIYPIISSGYTASQALNILGLSAKTAAASGADMSVVADMLTTSLKASGAPASEAGHYMDMFNKIVSLGKGEVPAYAAVIGKLTLAAGSAKVPFSDMGGALATLTTHGFPSVAQAANSLGNLFTQIGPKVDALKQHADKLKITFDENAFKTMGLSDKLAYLQKVTGGNQGELLKLLGGSTLALKAFGALTGSTADLTSNMNAMKDSAGATDSAYKTASEGFNASMNRMKASVDVLQIKIGQALLGSLTKITDAIGPIISNFSKWLTSSDGLQKSMKPLGDAIANVGKYIDGDDFQGFIADLQTVGNQIGILLVPLQSLKAPLGDIANDILPALGSVLKGLVSSIDNVVFPIGQFLLALNAGNPWAQAFVDILIGIGVAFAAIQIGAFIATIPALIAGFIAWATTAGAAAIATLAATWPLLAIGAAIAIAVALIILAVQHWGDIVKWLQGVWSGISKFFTGIWKDITDVFSGIGKWFGDKFTDAKNAIGNAFSGLGTIMHDKGNEAKNGFQQTMGNIGNWFSDRGKDIKATATNIGKGVVDAFNWMYQHNTYFKEMVDGIKKIADDVEKWLEKTWNNISNRTISIWRDISKWANDTWKLISTTITSIITTVVQWITDKWTAISSWIQAKWNWISTEATILWSAISKAVQDGWNKAIGFVSDIWNKISAIFSSAWTNYIAGPIGDLWNKISAIFSSAWNNYIAGPLGNLWNSITKWFSNIAGQAKTWGQNLIQGFIDGINSMLASVSQTASNITDTIAKFLGFHSPAKEGPGKDADKWGPNLIKMFSSDLLKGAPQIQTAVNAMVKPLAIINSTQIGSTPSLSSNAPTNAGDTHIHIYLDGKEISKQLGPSMVSQMRLQGARI